MIRTADEPRATLTCRRIAPWAWVIGWSLALGARSFAQEAVHTDSATAPSYGRLALRQTLQYARFGDDPTDQERDVEEWRTVTTIEYGLRPDLSLAAYVPVVYREVDYDGTVPANAGSDTTTADLGLDDVTLAVKWRFYTNDFGPIDTARAAITLGAELPAGADAFTSDSVDPLLGGVFTYIQGRHGFNGELLWKFTTDGDEEPVRAGEGQADALFYNASYLFRVVPESFSAGSNGALYAILEANGAYETNGDNELLISPGVLYEARGYALEASVQLPLWHDLDHRPETEVTVTVGIRFLF